MSSTQIINARVIADHFPELFSAVIGDETRSVSSAGPMLEASSEQVTFCRSPEAFVEYSKNLRAGIVIAPSHPIVIQVAENTKVTVLLTSNPRLAFMRVVREFFDFHRASAIHATAIIDSEATVHPTAWIGPYVVIDEGCVIGEGCVIHAHVHLYPRTILGMRVTIHSGSVIGADGFGYERNETGIFEKFPHLGGVVIGDDVEIGSNTSIDRGTLANTVISSGVKIDNQCHISHNVVIGCHTAVIAQSMLGGSAKVGAFSWIAPGACVMNQAEIGDYATIGLGAVVVKKVEDHQTVMGVPALPSERFSAVQAFLKRQIADKQ